jgi:hypothetical protein
MPAIAYAVHTATCTYLLDDEGICQWIQARSLDPTLAAPPGTERCVGAQFVACLDLGAEGGLVGELRLGASALFARTEGGRFVLLRTLPIEHIALQDPEADPHSFAPTPIYEPASEHRLPAFSLIAEQTAPLDARWSVPEELDLEDLLSMSVTEVTLALPLYRPPPGGGRSR